MSIFRICLSEVAFRSFISGLLDKTFQVVWAETIQRVLYKREICDRRKSHAYLKDFLDPPVTTERASRHTQNCQ